MSTPGINRPAAAALPKKVLAPGSEIHIIACERPAPARCIGVRWASLLSLGFPPSGYRLSRTNVRAGAAPDPLPLGDYFLPSTDSWAEFAREAEARRPRCGPYFESVAHDTHGFLLPLIRLVDPRTDAAEGSALVTQASAFFGPVHENEAELEWKFWRNAAPPPLAALLSDPEAGPEVAAFYRSTTLSFLLTLALRFEYAALLGLGTSDGQAVDNGAVQYQVEADWGKVRGAAVSRTVESGQRCAPPPPAWTRAARTPGSVPHRLFRSWPGWVAPPEMAPVTAAGDPLPLRAPRGPAAFTALAWAAPPAEPNLIGYGPVLYEVRRFSHGAASAARPTRPALPAAAVFREVIPGDLVIRSEREPHYIDLPGMDWPPLEGWYAYQVLGVDLLGVRSAPAPLAEIRHHDDFAPPAPGATLLSSHALTFNHPGAVVDVPVRIDWGAAQDFGGDDTAEFRVAGTWVPLNSVPIHVESVTDADTLHADLTVTTLPGSADQYAGLSLSLPGADFPIVTNGAGPLANVRVRKRRGALPPANTDGAIYAPGAPTPLTRVARQARRAAVAGSVRSVSSTDPVEFIADQAGGAPLPADAEISLYVHVLRASFAAVRLGAGRYRLAEPPAGQSGAEALARWRSLSDPTASLAGSPLIFFPGHTLTVSVQAPADFVSGLLVLGVSAADGAAYVESPVLPVADPSLAAPAGNESARTELSISVRSLAAPSAAPVASWDPGARVWAVTAANFAESATHELTWTAAAGAVRYEVWRAPEGALSGVRPSTPDADVRAAAAAQPAAFELRSDQVFSTRYVDSLPGRAPTRALYKIRAVSGAGVPGAWSDIVGPVYVPDIRRPAAPNLLRVAPARPDEADRALALEWTFAGPRDGVRFDVFAREAAAGDLPSPAGSVPKGAAPDATGRYRWIHAGRTPGRRYSYLVVAVREAPDPIDPAAVLTRDIAGPPSAEVTGTAISYGPLLAPSGVTATPDSGGGSVTIAWTNNDVYESVEVWRKPLGAALYARVGAALAGGATAIADAPPPGAWSYQVRAFGVRREARSDADAEVTVP